MPASSKDYDKQLRDKYLGFLSATARLLYEAGANDDMIKLHKNVIRYLRSLDNFGLILSKGRISSVSGKKPGRRQISKSQILNMTNGEIRKFATADDILKSDLEQIARLRFGMPTGELSKLKNKAALAENIISLIDHEETHKAIARLASKY